MATQAVETETSHRVQDPPRTRKADIRWLWELMLRHRRATIGAMLFGVLGGIASAAEPYLVGIIIDQVRVGISLGDLALYGVALVGLAVLTVFAFFWMRYYSGQVAFSVNYDMRKTLFDNLLTLEQRFFQQYPTGDIIARMHSDIEMTRHLMLLSLTRGTSAIFLLITTAFLLGTINLPLMLLAFVVLSISTYFQLRFGRIIANLFERVQDQGGVLSALVQDSVSGIQTIKTTNTEFGVAENYKRENKEYRRRWLFFKRRYEPIGMLPQMIIELTAGVIVLAGGYMVIQGALTIGEFSSFLIYLAVIGQALLQLGTMYQRYQQAAGALARLTPLLKEPEIKSAPNAIPLRQARGEIEFDNVSLKYEDSWILRNISLKIPAGSMVAIVGPTACGKTQLVNLIARINDPTEGRVLVDRVDVRELALEDLRAAMAYVPQTTFLFSQALHHNVRMGVDTVSDEAMERAIHISRVSNDLQQLPEGLNTMVGEKGVMLSGGQKQRVAIARALLRDPAILVLDDALSSVDTHTAADILGELHGVLESRTSIIIAHRISTVKDADFIVVMDEGHIIEQGTHEELVAAGGAYTRMVERELREEDRFYA